MNKSEPACLCCLGGGKMGESLIAGLLESGAYPPEKIFVVDPDPNRRALFRDRYQIRSLESPETADVYLLAMKPQDVSEALEQLRPLLKTQSLLVSICAGITTDWILARTGVANRLVRAMPNAAAVVRKSATGLFFCAGVGKKEKAHVLRIFDAVGMTVVVEKEDHLDVITGLSGSGPAYVFLFLEALTDAGVYLGISRDTASRLALQTLYGSACMAQELAKPFPLLKELITSPGGTTVAGLKILEEGAFHAALMNAVEAATQRSKALSR